MSLMRCDQMNASDEEASEMMNQWKQWKLREII